MPQPHLWSRAVRLLGALAIFSLLANPSPALAQATLDGPVAVDDAAVLDQIAVDLVSRGYSSSHDVDGEVLEAIDQANRNGIAFAWLATESDAVDLSIVLAEEMELRQAKYKTVLVLTDNGVAAWSFADLTQPQIDSGLDAAAPLFSRGDVAGGVLAFADTSANPSSSGGASGMVWFLAIGGAIVSVVWVGLGFISGIQRRRREAEEMEQDRAEIKQQLLDNADRVMNLGDLAIASGRQDLIQSYEEASASYQEVSRKVDLASDPAEVDALDDKIDHAEWQFEFIEASLEGREPPPSPSEVAAAEAAARALDKDSPALGPNQSILTPDQIPTPSRGGMFSIGHPRPRNRLPYGGYGSRRSRRRSSGGFGSMGSSRPRGAGGGRSFGSGGGRGGGRRI